MNKDTQSKNIYELCKEHIHAYVLAEMTDGTKIDGIITGLDDEYVYFAVPIDHAAQSFQETDLSNRQYWGGYGPGYGYPGYGYPRRRFNRLIIPLAAIAALSILPWY